MKKYLRILTVLLAFCCFVNLAYAEPRIDACKGCEKYYVQSCDVKVANNGIFVNFDGDMLNVPAIYVDDAGVYILGLGCCRVCGRPNDDLGYCQNARCKNYGKR